MIQIKVADVGDLIVQNLFDLDIYGEMPNTNYPEVGQYWRVLVTFKSQFTGKSKTVSASTNYLYKERYIAMGVWTTRDADQEILLEGVIQLGTTDFPLGFYDVTLYENNSNLNLDPTGLPVPPVGLQGKR